MIETVADTMRMWPLLIFVSSIIRVANATNLLPLLQYDMTTVNCQRSIFFNRGVLGKESIKLIRNSSTTTCTIGSGIESGYMGDGGDEKESKASATDKFMRARESSMERLQKPVAR